MRDATVDVCGACHGTFFASGEMFKASGVSADPSSWDLPETGGVPKPGSLVCPRCAPVVMRAQDVTHEGKHVEVDRCTACGGIWLDKGELDTIVAIGDALRPVLEAARAKAQAELEALGPVDFRKPAVPRWRGALLVAAAAVLLTVVGEGIYRWLTPAPLPRDPHPSTRAKGEEGCPCGCDRSAKMAADLREAHARGEGGEAAPKAIARSLVTIGEREDVGYVTERMVQHRLRLLGLAEELHVDTSATLAGASESRDRCAGGGAEDGTLRVCPELVVHGERVEIVDGHDKLIESCFRLWLEIENLTGEARALSPASLDGGAAVHLPVSRWYREGGRGEPWDGVLGAREKVRVNVIGYIPEHVAPGTVVDTRIAVGALSFGARTEARAVIHLR
jgi:Zn-finger nucleic acid-binding protein